MPKKNPAAVSLGRLGGQAGTKKQNAARAKNAQGAGPPRRVCADCGQPVFGGHRKPSDDRKCHMHAWVWQKPSER